MVKKVFGITLLLFNFYLLIENLFWQGPIMPQWRFFLGIIGPIIGILSGVFIFNQSKR